MPPTTILDNRRSVKQTVLQNRRLDLLLGAAVTLVAAVHVGLIVFWNPQLPAPDPDGLGDVVHFLMEGLGYRSNVTHEASAYPGPMSTSILAAIFTVAGNNSLTLHVYHAGVFIGTVLLTYYGARQITGPWFSAASALLVATYVPLLGGVLLFRYEGIQGFFTIAAIALTLNLLKQPGSLRGGFWGGGRSGS